MLSPDDFYSALSSRLIKANELSLRNHILEDFFYDGSRFNDKIDLTDKSVDELLSKTEYPQFAAIGTKHLNGFQQYEFVVPCQILSLDYGEQNSVYGEQNSVYIKNIVVNTNSVQITDILHSLYPDVTKN